MEHATQLNLAENAESVWREPQVKSEAAEKVFNPFVGICVGLGGGLLTWGLFLLIWYMLSA